MMSCRSGFLNMLNRYAAMKKTTATLIASSAVLILLSTVPPAALAQAGAAAAPAEQEIVLPVRGQQALPVQGLPQRVAVGDETVADVRVLPARGEAPAQVLIIGNKPGATRVQVWAQGSARPTVWRVRVAGRVHDALRERGAVGAIDVDHAADHAIISGSAASMVEHRAAVGAARAAAGEEKIVDTSTVSPGGVVQVEVRVVEVSQSVAKDVGLSFLAGRASDGTGSWGAASPTLSGAIADGFRATFDSSNFSARLGLLQSNGLARILAEPTLVALSGQSASFLAGGEIPIPQAGGLGTQNVTYKPFGIGLTVTPTVLSRERIALKVAPEASELDPTNGIQIFNGDNNVTLIPAIRTRRADTTVELGDGESFIISGLVSRQTIANVNKLPFLGDLPIIGAFFRSMRYSQEERELVIVVTPRLIRPIARGVNLPMPGARQEVADTPTNAWGSYLLGPLSGQQMPGFSR